MQQVFKQFVYCCDGSDFNSPKGLLKQHLIEGSLISEEKLNAEIDSIKSCVQLGVQAPPGTKFYINGGNEPIIVGSSGILTIDVSNGGIITNVIFSEQSVNYIAENDSRFLIIDTIRNKGD